MRQVWLAERALADHAAVPPKPVRMHFVEDAARDRGRNNLPTANEVAAVFVGEGGLPPRNINLVIYDTNPIDQQRRTQFIPAGLLINIERLQYLLYTRIEILPFRV